MGNPALARDAENPVWPVRGQIDKSLKAEPPCIHMIEHDRNQRLHTRHARRRVGIGLVFFLAGMRRVIRAEHVNRPIGNACPDTIPMRGIAHGRVHLNIRPQRLVILCAQRQVMGRSLGGDQILIRRKDRNLISGRDMQDMHPPVRLTRQRNQPLGTQHRRLHIAPLRMRRGITGAAHIHALYKAAFFFGVNRDPSPPRCEHLADMLGLIDQQIARRRAHEHLDARRPRQPLCIGQVSDILSGRAEVKRKVTEHAPRCADDLIRQRIGIGCQGLGVGHLKHRGDAAHHRRARSARQIFLVFHPRFTEMDLRINHPRQDMQARRIDDLARIAGRKITDFDDLALKDANIGFTDAVLIDDSAVLNQQIKGCGHGRVLS